jgi:hypothetical protein
MLVHELEDRQLWLDVLADGSTRASKIAARNREDIE